MPALRSVRVCPHPRIPTTPVPAAAVLTIRTTEPSISSRTPVQMCNSAADRDQYRFCSAKWCYVDAITCRVAHEVSKIASGHVYSYASCGFPDYYTSSKDLVLMRNL